MDELYMCVFSLLESELFKHELPSGIGVDVGTGIVVPDPTGVCGTVSPIVGMGLKFCNVEPHVCQIIYIS